MPTVTMPDPENDNRTEAPLDEASTEAGEVTRNDDKGPTTSDHIDAPRTPAEGTD